MPGSTPAISQLDWLISITAMIVVFWSRATRDLLKSFGWGIAHSIGYMQRRSCHFLAARRIASLGSPRDSATSKRTEIHPGELGGVHLECGKETVTRRPSRSGQLVSEAQAKPCGRPTRRHWRVKVIDSRAGALTRCGYDARTSWPRISPPLFASVWILTYHFPASSCAICASVNVAEPLIGLARLPVNGTTTPAFAPGSAGPWICAAVAEPLRPE